MLRRAQLGGRHHISICWCVHNDKTSPIGKKIDYWRVGNGEDAQNINYWIMMAKIDSVDLLTIGNHLMETYVWYSIDLLTSRSFQKQSN